MFKKISEETVELTEQMTDKFVEITIFAVNKEGVVDKATVEIENAKCGDNDEHIEESDAEESSLKIETSSTVSKAILQYVYQDTLYSISLIILMVILIILLSIFIIIHTSDKKLSPSDDSIGCIAKDAFLTTKDDFEIDHQIYKFF